jgi:hypothetical protein
MANRVLAGKRGSDYGLWVSKPGYDVLTANFDQLIFNPYFAAMRAVVRGTATIPSNQPYYSSDGNIETTATVSYGETLSHVPYVIAIAQTSVWQVQINWHNGAGGKYYTDYGSMTGVWITECNITIYPQNLVGYFDGVLCRGSNPGADAYVHASWAAARFEIRPSLSSVVFAGFTQADISVRYIVLDVG